MEMLRAQLTRLHFVDLREDGKNEALVYLSSRNWCGTAGCTLLVLHSDGASYKLVTKLPAVRLPILLLFTKSNGWHDLSVIARTSGTEPLYQAVLTFDGKSYPDNINAARPLSQRVQGKIVIAADGKDERLYR